MWQITYYSLFVRLIKYVEEFIAVKIVASRNSNIVHFFKGLICGDLQETKQKLSCYFYIKLPFSNNLRIYYHISTISCCCWKNTLFWKNIFPCHFMYDTMHIRDSSSRIIFYIFMHTLIIFYLLIFFGK